MRGDVLGVEVVDLRYLPDDAVVAVAYHPIQLHLQLALWGGGGFYSPGYGEIRLLRVRYYGEVRAG